MLNRQATEQETSSKPDGNQRQTRLAVEPSDARRDRRSQKHHSEAQADIDPEQRADLIASNLFLLDCRRGKSQIFEHRDEARHDGNHSDKTVIIGSQQARENHGRNDTGEELKSLRSDGQCTAPSAFPNQSLGDLCESDGLRHPRLGGVFPDW